MLNRSKVLKELQGISAQLFLDLSPQINVAKRIWQQIIVDETFCQKVAATKAPWPLPTWQGTLDETTSIQSLSKPYSVLAVDGSQIYPDKHQGTSCFLINIGSMHLQYGDQSHGVQVDSEPYVFVPVHSSTGYTEAPDQVEHSIDVVNGRREELEFKTGLSISKHYIADQELPFVFLFDGSLIFWHLESKETHIRDYFLGTYFCLLQQFQQAEILMAGYLSMSKSKELVNLIRIALCNFDLQNQEACKTVDHLVDTHVASFFLQPFQRSIVFKNNSSIASSYPDDIKPHFFYLHVGDEIARIEIPAWIASDEQRVNRIASIILDQCAKGRGYPVCLAEAHEQAVVKGPDREFFYYLIQKLGFARKKRIHLSPKNIKKRGIGI